MNLESLAGYMLNIRTNIAKGKNLLRSYVLLLSLYNILFNLEIRRDVSYHTEKNCITVNI